MNAPTRIHPLAIDKGQLCEVIARAVMLRDKPSRGGLEWLGFLCSLDVVIGNDVLTDLIADMEHDLGIGDADEPECLACDQPSCSCDARYDDHTAWGMTVTDLGNGRATVRA